jgi:Domain of unknown function (DUF4440)
MSPPTARVVLTAFLFAAAVARAEEGIPALLQKKTQALFDAVGKGDAALWRAELDDRVLFTTEDGEVLDKAKLVEQIRPLPPGVTGSIQVRDFRSIVQGTIAVTSYVSDEQEGFHGQALHCQYRSTDTWVKSGGGWKLLAGQILALRVDPPELRVEPAKLTEYCGRYTLGTDLEFEIRCLGDSLEGHEAKRPPKPLRFEARDVLFVPGAPRYRRIFQRDAQGRITGFVERREAWNLSWKRVP